jgi:hypothetical protein
MNSIKVQNQEQFDISLHNDLKFVEIVGNEEYYSKNCYASITINGSPKLILSGNSQAILHISETASPIILNWGESNLIIYNNSDSLTLYTKDYSKTKVIGKAPKVFKYHENSKVKILK